MIIYTDNYVKLISPLTQNVTLDFMIFTPLYICDFQNIKIEIHVSNSD